MLCCGNGTSAANAQHFAASMINRFETERPSLPAIALNTDNVVLTAISHRSARIQEMHMLTVNCLCDLIDNEQIKKEARINAVKCS
ncbi:hypothetical protein ACN56_15070 [Escherichia coli]|nr:hypothetical protein ACN56_15070 [Escherichia coli]